MGAATIGKPAVTKLADGSYGVVLPIEMTWPTPLKVGLFYKPTRDTGRVLQVDSGVKGYLTDNAFMREYMGYPCEQPDDRHRMLAKVGSEYFGRCDGHDRQVCTGKGRDGSVIPADYIQQSKCSGYAVQVRNDLMAAYNLTSADFREALRIADSMSLRERRQQADEKTLADAIEQHDAIVDDLNKLAVKDVTKHDHQSDAGYYRL